MTRIKPKVLALIGCVVISLWLVTAQLLASNILLLPCLICFVVFAVWATNNDLAMPVLLFFLPWAPLFKISPGSISIYTVALVMVLALVFVRGSKNISVIHILPALALLALTLCVKLAYSYSLANSYFLFFALLFVFPLIVREIDACKYDFYELTVFFSLGIIIGALLAQLVSGFPTISRYMGIHTSQSMTRYCGFYGDPNLYSAHITAAISGILIVVAKGNKIGRQIFLTAVLLILVYCGFISVSKSFALIFICLVLLWIVQMLMVRGKLSDKMLALLMFSIAGIFLLSSTIFSDVIDTMMDRFIDSGSSLSAFTTKRTDLWMNYFMAFERNPLLLLFGSGFTNTLIGDRASHNTLIQMVYQFGIVGSIFFVVWFICFVKLTLRSLRIEFRSLLPILILMIGSFGPWMALDFLFFDELFLISFYVMLGIRFVLLQEDTNEQIEIEQRNIS